MRLKYKQFDVDMPDIHLGNDMAVTVTSDSVPSARDLKFAKIGKRLYSATFTPQETGTQEVLGGLGAVNYETEYRDIGMNPRLKDSISAANGAVFDEQDVDGIVDKVIRDSRRILNEPVSYSWIFLLSALALFLLEIAVRRMAEGRQNIK